MATVRPYAATGIAITGAAFDIAAEAWRCER
ncbi:hypothetical protein Mycsm_06754 (plasmid) [Mycobacterium sp. JS623]|nr:hypothetical protein Mycsm_06754 [Mycobacterium sp. JS623]